MTGQTEPDLMTNCPDKPPEMIDNNYICESSCSDEELYWFSPPHTPQFTEDQDTPPPPETSPLENMTSEDTRRGPPEPTPLDKEAAFNYSRRCVNCNLVLYNAFAYKQHIAHGCRRKDAATPLKPPSSVFICVSPGCTFFAK